MANDIKIIYNPEIGEYDIQYSGGDLLREDGMTTAVIMSLLTDRRANADDKLINVGEKCGWWGDLLEDDGDKIGSRLWLFRGKTDNNSLAFVKDVIKESLQWFIKDQVWQKFEVFVESQGQAYNKILAFQINAYYENGQNISYKFKDLWGKEIGLTISA